MFELRGKYGSAKVFTDLCDQTAISQLQLMLNQPFTDNSQIRIMPDVHAGAGCTIGTTMTIQDKIVPNLVGVDVGCGMLAVKIKEKDIDLPKLDDIIHKKIPSGFNVHETIRPFATTLNAEQLKCFHKAPINEMLAYCSVGTLGGGNHFLEVDKDSNNNFWLVIHTGSRHLGLEVCNYYQNLAYERLKEKGGYTLHQKEQTLIAQLKAEHREQEISDALKKLKANFQEILPSIPKDLAYLEGTDFDDYIHDMHIVQQHAVSNRAEIARVILMYMDWHEEERFETIHNYIDTEHMILRKGSVSAQNGEKLLIPINMRDGSLLCIGKGNPDWNYSAPHGAGRLMSRSQAKETVSLDAFKESMTGIYTTSVNRSTIDESPMAYKPMNAITENIKDTVDIIDVLKPIYNFKASDA